MRISQIDFEQVVSYFCEFPSRLFNLESEMVIFCFGKIIVMDKKIIELFSIKCLYVSMRNVFLESSGFTVFLEGCSEARA